MLLSSVAVSHRRLGAWLILHVARNLDPGKLCRSRWCRSHCSRLWCSGRGAHVELERDLRPVGLLLFAFTVLTYKVEVLAVSFSLRYLEALAVLPDTALLTCHTVSAIIDVLAIYATARTIENPIFIVFQLLEIFLVLRDPLLKLTLRPTRATLIDALLLLSSSSNLFFCKNALEFSVFDALLACHHARLAILQHLLLFLLVTTSSSEISSPLPLSLDFVLLLLLSLKLSCYSGRTFCSRHLLQRHQLSFASFDLSPLLLFGSLDDRYHFVDQTFS